MIEVNKSNGSILLVIVVILASVGLMALLLGKSSQQFLQEAANTHERAKGDYTAEAVFIIAEKGIDQDGDCLAYVSPSGELNGINYTSNVIPNAGSPITLTTVVDFGNGASKEYSREIKVFQPKPDLLILPQADVYIDEANNGSNYETDEKLKLKNPSSNDFIRSLLKFDLSALSIPEHQIESATLELYFESISGPPGASPDAFSAHVVEQTWTESEASWNKRTNSKNWSQEGGTFDSTVIAETIIEPASFGWVSWEITQLTSDWISGNTPNYGLLIKNVNVNEHNFKFHSNDSPQTGLRPVLRIQYNCECGQTCL